MAGNLRLLNETGVVVRGPIAMGLTSGVSGIDYIGGNIFYATDTDRLYKLHYQDGSLNIVGSSVDVVSQIANGIKVKGMTTNASGHWIGIEAMITTPMSDNVVQIHRFDLDGNWLYKLPNYSVTTSTGAISFDMSNDGKNLFIAHHRLGTFGSGTTYFRKCYFDNARSIRTFSKVGSGKRFNAFCCNGKDIYAIKVIGQDMIIVDYNYNLIRDFGTGSFRADGLCSLRGIGSASGLEPFEDSDIGYDDICMTMGNPVVAGVT